MPSPDTTPMSPPGTLAVDSRLDHCPTSGERERLYEQLRAANFGINKLKGEHYQQRGVIFQKGHEITEMEKQVQGAGLQALVAQIAVIDSPDHHLRLTAAEAHKATADLLGHAVVLSANSPRSRLRATCSRLQSEICTRTRSSCT